MIKAFLKRLFCFHRRKKCWSLEHIGIDGTSYFRCTKCGKLKKFPLK